MEVNIRRASLKDIPYLTKLLQRYHIRTLYIDDLCVDEEFRGEHIGKMLYEYVLAYAKEKNYYNVTLNVQADNINAVKFYERIGMRIQKIGMEAIL